MYVCMYTSSRYHSGPSALDQSQLQCSAPFLWFTEKENTTERKLIIVSCVTENKNEFQCSLRTCSNFIFAISKQWRAFYLS